MSDLTFYQQLPTSDDFNHVLTGSAWHDLPADWWIVIADVVNSTDAIQRGAYKEVNTVGVACIAALSNLLHEHKLDFPYLFGGDGATFAIPPSWYPQAVAAIRATQQMAKQRFGLMLRAGAVPVAVLLEQGYRVQISKYQLSTALQQAVFAGNGWQVAEQWVKQSHSAVHTITPEALPVTADFSGFECRWQTVPSFRGAKLALLVAANTDDEKQHVQIYQQVLAKIAELFGDAEQSHPLRPEAMQLSLQPTALQYETAVRTFDTTVDTTANMAAYRRKIWWINAIGKIIFACGIDTKAVAWSRYRQELVQHTDCRKFDGMLRMVLDGSTQQIAALEHYLQQQQSCGLLHFGMHVSSQALVTCVVHAPGQQQHIHFVDGADGGYALAAQQMKQTLR